MLTKYVQDVRRLVATCMCQVLRFPKDYVTQRQRTIRAYSLCESLVIRDICAIYVIHSVSSRAQMNVFDRLGYTKLYTVLTLILCSCMRFLRDAYFGFPRPFHVCLMDLNH